MVYLDLLVYRTGIKEKGLLFGDQLQPESVIFLVCSRNRMSLSSVTNLDYLKPTIVILMLFCRRSFWNGGGHAGVVPRGHQVSVYRSHRQIEDGYQHVALRVDSSGSPIQTRILYPRLLHSRLKGKVTGRTSRVRRCL